MIFLPMLVVVALCVALAAGDMRASGPGFDFFCTGNCTDVAPPTRAGIIFMGGGPDVDAGYKVGRKEKKKRRKRETQTSSQDERPSRGLST